MLRSLLIVLISELDIPEPYFYYIAMHWPTEDRDKSTNIEYLPTYDEEILTRYVINIDDRVYISYIP